MEGPGPARRLSAHRPLLGAAPALSRVDLSRVDLPTPLADALARWRAPSTSNGLTLDGLLAAARWIALGVGVMLSLPTINAGSARLAVPMALAVFLAVWRTLRPAPLTGAHHRYAMVSALPELAAVLTAVVVSHGWNSPFLVSLGVGVVITGASAGLIVGVCAWVVAGSVTAVAGLLTDQGTPTMPTAIAAVSLPLFGTMLAALGARRLAELETRRQEALRQISLLQGTNDALVELTRSARAGTPLDPAHLSAEMLGRLAAAFPDAAVGVYLYNPRENEWTLEDIEVSRTQPGPPAGSAGEALHRRKVCAPVTPAPLTLAEGWGAALYVPLFAREEVIGVVVVERPDCGQFAEADIEAVRMLGEALALAVDNLVWLRRLRTLGAEDERARLARDLHDRLGQWYAHIAFEIERIIDLKNDQARTDALKHLHGNAREAVSELRDTLWLLRATITPESGFVLVAEETARRFEQRTGLELRFDSTPPEHRLSVRVELEVLRILQEALNNVERHADASAVRVTWTVDDALRHGTLCVVDDGRGFDPVTINGDHSYGLRGMRERADAIEAEIAIISQPGSGTRVEVHIEEVSR